MENIKKILDIIYSSKNGMMYFYSITSLVALIFIILIPFCTNYCLAVEDKKLNIFTFFNNKKGVFTRHLFYCIKKAPLSI